MKKMLKGLAACSLSLVLGNSLLFNSSVDSYEIKNVTKTEKTGINYTFTDKCVSEENTEVRYEDGSVVKLGEVKAVVRYYEGGVEIEICDNPTVHLITSDCTNSGGEFQGWYYDEAFTQKVEGTTVGDALGNPAIEIKRDDEGCIKEFNYITNLYAKCEDKKVEDKCEDTNKMYTVNYVIGDTVISKETAEAGKEIQASKPTREGYKFDGWYIDKELTTKFDGNINLTEKYAGECLTGYEDVTLYGKWLESDAVCDPVEYAFKLIYNTNGGNAINEKTVNNSNKTEKIETPSRKGYEFKGWYLDEQLTQKASATTLGELTTEKYIDENGCAVGYKNVTLYAAWESSNNPDTGDNIIIYFILGIGLIGGSIIVTKKLTNK